MHEALQNGTVIQGRYCILGVLGHGGSGITYEAEETSTGHRVALKELSLRGLSDWKKLSLFEREAQVLAELDHPAIPKYVEYFQIDTADDRFFYIAQELVEGTSLAHLVAAGKRFSEDEVQCIAWAILQVLQYLHELNPPVIHRDIKPQNIIRREDGYIFLVDFGAVQTVYRHTVAFGSTIVGTYGYMAPEQFQGQAFPATDLYGLGTTLLNLLTHKQPADFPQKRLKYNFRPYIRVSEAFADWLDKVLEPLVEDRCDSAETALSALPLYALKKDEGKADLKTRSNRSRPALSQPIKAGETLLQSQQQTTLGKTIRAVGVASGLGVGLLWIALVGPIGPASKTSADIFEAMGKPAREVKLAEPDTSVLSTNSGMFETFYDWCINKAYLPIQAHLTVERLQAHVDTQDCNTAASRLTNLDELDFQDGTIELAIVATLTNLTSLELSNTQVTDVAPLTNLPNLRSLFLKNNPITDISALAQLTNLEFLHVRGSEILDVSPLANLSNLEMLDLGINQIRDISPLANLSNLTRLYLDGNEIRDVLPLANLSNLIELSLDANGITDVSPLSSLTNLTLLSLGDNQIEEGSCPVQASICSFVYSGKGYAPPSR